MNFSDVLASSVHDIKNSLGMVINTLEEMLSDPNTRIGNPNQASIVQKEAQRANNHLIQLLLLYKLEKEQLEPNLNEHNADDFLSEVQAENVSLMEDMGIEFSYECDAYLSSYFDEDLVRGVLNNAISNSVRYTKDRIALSAASEEGYLVFRVEDNGSGFPAQMLADQAAEPTSDSFQSGSTQLGHYFASQIAHLHSNGERRGFVRLKNGHQLEGGCFELWLP